MFSLLITHLKQIVQIVDDDVTEFLKGPDMSSFKILTSESATLCILVDAEGKIVYVGNEAGFDDVIGDQEVVEKLDGNGGIALPGFVDAHSHPVFAGDRVHEFAMKLAGATYMEVQKAGGGIMFTTRKTREASRQELEKDFGEIAEKMLRSGTTTLEAKSGYGLDTKTEVKMLEVLSNVSTKLEVSATFCGAHAVPEGTTEDNQTEVIVNETIPKLVELKKNGLLHNLENIDVFCEKGVFEILSSRRILLAGKQTGLRINFHAEELNYIGGVEMGTEIGATAMSHLEEISDEGVDQMAKKGTVAVLLPSTAFILRLTPPPARRMIDNGVIVALGSDFNPNAYCYAMPMIMHFACITMKLSMKETLVAATLNSAHSIGRGRTHGAIAVGRIGDIVLLEAESWEHIIYRVAAHQDIIRHVIKKGVIIH